MISHSPHDYFAALDRDILSPAGLSAAFDRNDLHFPLDLK